MFTVVKYASNKIADIKDCSTFTCTKIITLHLTAERRRKHNKPVQPADEPVFRYTFVLPYFPFFFIAKVLLGYPLREYFYSSPFNTILLIRKHGQMFFDLTFSKCLQILLNVIIPQFLSIYNKTCCATIQNYFYCEFFFCLPLNFLKNIPE